MIGFIVAAAGLSLLAIGFVTLPLLRARAGAPRAATTALAVALVLIAAGGGLYLWLGDGAYSSGAVQEIPDQSIATLARRVEHDPQDLEGWLSLGQAYDVLGNYALALRCFQHANRLAGGSNAEALAGMGEAMLLSGDAEQAQKASELLERALQINPHETKALFYSAAMAYQQGRLQVARERFSTMLTLGPPDSVRDAIQHQIADIDAQLRGEPDPALARAAAAAAAQRDSAAASPPDAATAIHLHVTLIPALADKLPADASLFVFVRAPGGGPPLAVKRSVGRLPQDVELSAADAMVAGRGVRPGQPVSVVARLSASGNPLPQSGDLYGEINTVAGKSGAQALQIDKLNP